MVDLGLQAAQSNSERAISMPASLAKSKCLLAAGPNSVSAVLGADASPHLHSWYIQQAESWHTWQCMHCET